MKGNGSCSSPHRSVVLLPSVEPPNQKQLWQKGKQSEQHKMNDNSPEPNESVKKTLDFYRDRFPVGDISKETLMDEFPDIEHAFTEQRLKDIKCKDYEAMGVDPCMTIYDIKQRPEKHTKKKKESNNKRSIFFSPLFTSIFSFFFFIYQVIITFSFVPY